MSDEKQSDDNGGKSRRGRPPKLDNLISAAVEDLLVSAKENRKTVYEIDENGESKPVQIGPELRDKSVAVRTAIEWIKVKHKIDDGAQEGAEFGDE